MDNTIEKAKKFAEERHKGQFRRDGVTPYFEHVRRVAELVSGSKIIKTMRSDGNIEGSDSFVAIAYLHDVVEDGKATYEEIKEQFGFDIYLGVKMLTHDKYADYFNYIKDNVKGYSIDFIKHADLLDNLSDSPTEKQVKKYSKALKILLGFEE